MSGVVILRTLLAARPALTAKVPAARIFIGIAPLNTTMPAISISRVSGNEQGTVARNLDVKMMRERVQVTVLAKNYKDMDEIRKLADPGRGVHTGVVQGYAVKSVIPLGDNPDLPPGDDGVFETSKDFMVTFVEAS